MKATKGTIIRDLSWLAFNARVLQEAQGPPPCHVFDRMKFLGIYSNNLDEFFRVRVATLSRMARLGKTGKMHLEANPEKILAEIQKRLLAQQAGFDQTYADIISELERQRIFIKNDKQLSRVPARLCEPVLPRPGAHPDSAAHDREHPHDAAAER